MVEPEIVVWRDGAAWLKYEGREILVASSGGVCFMDNGKPAGIHHQLVPWRHLHWLVCGNGLDAKEDHVP